MHLFPGGQRDITNRLDDDSGQHWVPVVPQRRPQPRGRNDAAQTGALRPMGTTEERVGVTEKSITVYSSPS